MSDAVAFSDIARRLFAEDLAGGGWEADAALVRRAAEASAPPSAPAGLFGRPCPLPAGAWHFQQLEEIGRRVGGRSETPVQRARRLYHQRMLAHLIAPGEERWRPSVTILIPVFNRPDLLIQAVRSCLEQSWRPIEILVIDDGSTNDIVAALREFGEQVRLYRKPNGGAASARNLGIQHAQGDLIHFLDSDDLLLPDAVARKMQSFMAIPDAALCYSMAIEQNIPGVRTPRIRVPDGTEHCTTSDFLDAALHRCPFYVPTVMMPRWATLAFPPFEEDLRRGEDSRYWVRLGLADAKVIGLAEPLIVRRVVPDGLSTVPHVGETAVDIKLRDLRDVIRAPSAWHHAGYLLLRFAEKLEQSGRASPLAPDSIRSFADVKAALSAMGDGRLREGLSPLPLLLDLRHALQTAKPHLCDRWPTVWLDLQVIIAAALRSAAPMTSRDLVHWAQNPSRALASRSVVRLFRDLLQAAEREPDIVSRIDPVLRRSFPAPSRRSIKRYRKLRRRLRSGRLAAWLTWPRAHLSVTR